MGKSKVLILVAVGFVGGIWLGSVWHVVLVWLYLVLGLLVVLLVLMLEVHGVSKFVVVGALSVVCGMVRLEVLDVGNYFSADFGSKVEVQGVIVEDVDVRLDKQFLTFRPDGSPQSILLTVPLTTKFFYGDRVVIVGMLVAAKNSDMFDYKKYLERFNVYGVMSYPKALILKSHRGNWFKELLLRIKMAFAKRVGILFAEPQSSLLLGIIIGAKRTLPQNIIDQFNATGTSHIIAISGFNITIIIQCLAYLARYIGRRASFWVSLGIIVAFVVMAGASASVMRASVMGVLLLVSTTIGRQYRIAPALFFSAFAMLFINPKILFWDVGFQLSFAATLGIIYFMPLLEQITEGWPNPLQVKSILLTTLSAMVATLPLIMLYFGRLSLVAPLVNILILPLLPLTMLVGFCCVLPLAGPGFAFVGSLLLAYILRVTEIFSHVPHGNFIVVISPWVFVLLIFFAIGLYFGLKYWVARKMPAVEARE